MSLLVISECWTQMIDVHGFGGMFRDFTTIGECQAACEKDNTCVAIDWEPSNVGKSCWFLTSTATGDTLHRGVIIHYQLDRACLSQCHFYFARFSFTLHRVPSLDDIVFWPSCTLMTFTVNMNCFTVTG